MKRSIKNVFMIIVILVTSIATSINVVPIQALGTMVPVDPLALPTGLQQGQLKGIWGDETTHNMYAVGVGLTGTASKKPLIYKKSVSGWTATQLADIPLPTTPTPAWTAAALQDVWGASDSNVYAVGTGGETTPGLPLVLHWNGSAWASSRPDLPSTDWNYGELHGVWVSTGGSIYAVGFVSSPSFPNQALVLSSSNGTTWNSAALPPPTGYSQVKLMDVWGSSTGKVYAVGYALTPAIMPLVYDFTNTAWIPVTLPVGWTGGTLDGIWGSGDSDIYAVGTAYDAGNNNLPIIYHWDGSDWNWVTPSLPTAYWGGTHLYGVWGTGAGEVYAVGYGFNGDPAVNTEVPLLYRKTSYGWAPSSYSPSGLWASGHFESIWGFSTTDVYALGYGRKPNEDQPLISSAGLDATPPGAVTGLSAASGTLRGTVDLNWTAPADDGYTATSGPVDYYTVNYATSSAALTSCTAGTPVPSADLPIPAAPDSPQTMTVSAAANLTPGTEYYFVVCAWDDDGGHSVYAVTHAPAAPQDRAPGKATLTSPSGSITTSVPTYKWRAVPGSTWYYLWVSGPSGAVIQTWYTAAQANCTSTTCSVTPATILGVGAHSWWIQTYNAAGYGLWSDRMDFTAPVPAVPGKTTLASPSGAITTNSPIYSWTAVSGSTWYYLWVSGPSGTVIQTWYTAGQANCASGAGVCSVTPTTMLSGGAHSWWVQTYNAVGNGPWSDRMDFTSPSPTVPGKATLTSPSGSITTNSPTYTWRSVSGSTWYYLWVSGPSGTVIQTWYTAAQANCNPTTCSVTPSVPLSGGAYSWWIQTYNAVGSGPWSDRMDFTAPTPAVPGPATLTSPSGAITTHTPTYTWNAVSGSTWYYLWVSGPSGNVIQTWYTAAQANCPSGTGTCTVTPSTTLGSGAHSWWIQTYNSVGYGPWSTRMDFTTP